MFTTTAEAEAIDLFVLGTSGRGGVTALLGSFTQRILRSATC